MQKLKFIHYSIVHNYIEYITLYNLLHSILLLSVLLYSVLLQCNKYIQGVINDLEKVNNLRIFCFVALTVKYLLFKVNEN